MWQFVADKLSTSKKVEDQKNQQKYVGEEESEAIVAHSNLIIPRRGIYTADLTVSTTVSPNLSGSKRKMAMQMIA